MPKPLNWDDLRLFLAVARTGGLAGASKAVGASPPTLGRRVHALEQSIGTTLFERHRNGYTLTPDGNELLALAEDLEQNALRIDQWTRGSERVPVVRIAAGGWTSAFIARHAKDLAGTEGLAIEIVSSADDADILRREAHLGIRNRRPDGPGLARQLLGPVDFAVYGARIEGAAPEVQPSAAIISRNPDWVVFQPSGTRTPSSLWLDLQLQRQPALVCSAPHTALEAVHAGVGLILLPRFTGDNDSLLIRLSNNVEELRHDRWLVSHNDDRHLPHVRSVTRKLVALMRGRSAKKA